MLVAQLDRVTGYEPVGRGFESLQARQEKPYEFRKAFLIVKLFLYIFLDNIIIKGYNINCIHYDRRDQHVY